jgi:hypothetical protein
VNPSPAASADASWLAVRVVVTMLALVVAIAAVIAVVQANQVVQVDPGCDLAFEAGKPTGPPSWGWFCEL